MFTVHSEGPFSLDLFMLGRFVYYSYGLRRICRLERIVYPVWSLLKRKQKILQEYPNSYFTNIHDETVRTENPRKGFCFQLFIFQKRLKPCHRKRDAHVHCTQQWTTIGRPDFTFLNSYAHIIPNVDNYYYYYVWIQRQKKKRKMMHQLHITNFRINILFHVNLDCSIVQLKFQHIWLSQCTLCRNIDYIHHENINIEG